MPETVILLHGIWMPARVMAVLGARLRRCGYRVQTFDYHSLTASLPQQAHALAAFVRRQGEHKLHLVGHSLGGLVILQALQSHPDLVGGRIVLLGSPVNGSLLAKRLQRSRYLRWMLGRGAGQALPQGAPAWDGQHSLGVIAGTRPLGIGILLGGLAGENDGTVTVAETRLDNAAASLCIDTTHTGLVISRRVAAEVCRFLREGHFSDE